MDFGALLAPRSVEDILAERVRLTIGETEYALPVLSIKQNRVWKQLMEAELGYLIAQLDREDDTDAIMALFDGSEQVWLSLLLSYDQTHVLPPREEIEGVITPLGLVRAVLEVWRAARPLADIAMVGLDAETTTSTPTAGWLGRTSSWLRRTAGRPDTSTMN